MPVDLAVSARSRKRAELAGEIIAREAALDQLRADLAHLDAAIRIMCPDAEPELIRPKKPSRKGCDWFGRGELARWIMDVLRGATEPVGSTEIARTIMERKGLPAGDAVACGGHGQGRAAQARGEDGGEGGNEWRWRRVALGQFALA